jgi:ornithine cyclodeaminase/alanine dehydrogenase-like protein (mu-crystallin family)
LGPGGRLREIDVHDWRNGNGPAPMSGTVLRLRADDVWTALEVIDPVEALAEDLIGRQVERTGHRYIAADRVRPWDGSEQLGAECVELDCPGHSAPCVLPADSVRAAGAAALTTIAGRELLVAGGTTLAMLGPAEVAQPQLSMIARHIPDISHVALWMGSAAVPPAIEPKLADQLDLEGIGVSVGSSVADSVFGANFVVTTSGQSVPADPVALRVDQLAPGTVLVNATGEDLPAALVDHVDQVYVDDHGLLGDHRDRRVVETYLEDRWSADSSVVGGDLAELLTGRAPGRRQPDDIVLVELLGARELNALLAQRICDGAMRTGLGVWTNN